jgi:hypothetical protein
MDLCYKWEGDSMGTTNPLIISVMTPEYKKVIIEASNGVRYYSDLSSLSQVYCFPAAYEQWSHVTPDSFGSALIWSSRFEAHIDQIIGLAYKQEKIQKTA